MRLEFLSTGNELLDGSVVDTNAAYFCEQAFVRGALVAQKLTLPDDLPALAAGLHALCERADFAVVSGGLGPTRDDLTLEAVALAAGVPLVTDSAQLERIRERFARRGIAFTENNARQARIPEGAQVVVNRFGTAPMVVFRIGRAELYFLPGVPREFHGLCDEEVLPRLERRLAREPHRVFRAARVLKCTGIGESLLDATVKELPAHHPKVKVGFRTHAPENHLKLLAEASTDVEAQALLAAAEAEARALLGDRVFGADRESFPAAVLAALRSAGATLALAESCTGGLCASLLASVPGASERLVFSAVVYQDGAKSSLLGLDAALVEREGAVSAKVTRALAEAARAKAGATLAVAITGWAGPGGGTAEDPVGTVYLCLCDERGAIEERTLLAGFERERVRAFAAYRALDLVRRRAAQRAP
jgi:nicotinamide-nucleotide amidase